MLTFAQKYTGRGEIITSYNPATGEPIGEVRSFTIEEARAAIERARQAQVAWAAKSLDGRSEVLRRFQQILLNRAPEVCELLARENGKTLQEAMLFEVLSIVDLIDYFCDRAKNILGDQWIPMHLFKHRRSFINHRPRGVVLIISPWNFPFNIPNSTLIMALLAGNAVVQKPASLTPLIALKTQEMMVEAGLDPDLFQVTPTPGAIGSAMIGMGVNFVNFTGSTRVGAGVSELCGRLMIPCSMELGGKAPAIVCADADLELAAGSIVWGGLANAGQICASVERVYAHESIHDALVEKIVARVKKLRVGDPLAGEVDMGPMVDPGQLAIVEKLVADAAGKGAKVLTGGERLSGAGQFFAPTILADVTEDMDIAHEEIFGPAIPIMKVADDEEAIARANRSDYGLLSYVFSTDRRRARDIATRIESGTVIVNEVLITYGAPETPWQGCKKSGVGRAHSDQGLRELCYPYHINEEALPAPSKSPLWQPYSDKMYRRALHGAKALYGKGCLGRLGDLRKTLLP